jgi:hypothetical protein
MKKLNTSKWINYAIALVWITNGLLCKVLSVVPRHQEIVARILPEGDARIWTLSIGFAEIGMAAWILSGFMARLNATVQIVVIATMNVLEFIMAPDLLLWGRLNALFAFLFILVIFYNEFCLRNKLAQQV